MTKVRAPTESPMKATRATEDTPAEAPASAGKKTKAAKAAAGGQAVPKRIRNAPTTKPVALSKRATKRMALRARTALKHCAPAMVNQFVLDAIRKTLSTVVLLNVGANRVVINTRAVRSALESRGSLLSPALID